MKGFFNFLGKKQDEMTQEERRNKSILTLLGYGIFFALIIVIGYIGNTQNQGNNNDNNKNKDELLQKYEEIQKNNFDCNISIIADADILLVSARRENKEKEAIVKKYREEISYYYRQDNIFYETNQEFNKFDIKENLDIYNGYDTTFLNIDNIVEMLKTGNKIYLTEENHSIARYKIDDNEVLKVYNSVNNTNYITNKDFDVIVNVHFRENIEKIEIKLTGLYNVIKGNYENVVYTIEYNDINNITLPNIEILQ